MYQSVKENLDIGRKVYFSGTPCQIDGLLSYLRKDYDNLITQDIVCHGAPSPKVWMLYLQERNKEFGGTPTRMNFRQKNSGWNSFELFLQYKNWTYVNTLDTKS